MVQAMASPGEAAFIFRVVHRLVNGAAPDILRCLIFFSSKKPTVWRRFLQPSCNRRGELILQLQQAGGGGGGGVEKTILQVTAKKHTACINDCAASICHYIPLQWLDD